MNPRENRKPKAAPTPVPKPSGDAGARPLSERQREHLSHLHAAHVGRPETVGTRTVTSYHRPETKPVTQAKFKSGMATTARQRDKKRANRKRVNWGKVLLRGAVAVLCATVVAALVFSPRLWVKNVQFTGNATVPTERLAKRLAVAPRTNVLRFLWERPRRVAALRAEATVEAATIAYRFPDGLAVSVTEREPFAAVKFESEPGMWYTLDRNRVPFRLFRGVPEAGLPLVSVASGGKTKPVLGKSCDAPGLTDVAACLAWAKRQGDNFPVEKITVDSGGKLCLNRAGGMRVLLGPGLELNEKLSTLSLLLTKRDDLRGSTPTDIAAVNLYAYDAPALVPRVDGNADAAPTVESP